MQQWPSRHVLRLAEIWGRVWQVYQRFIPKNIYSPQYNKIQKLNQPNNTDSARKGYLAQEAKKSIKNLRTPFPKTE